MRALLNAGYYYTTSVHCLLLFIYLLGNMGPSTVKVVPYLDLD